MERIIKGTIFVVGDHVDTDQIIPAKYLVYNMELEEEKKWYGAYALSGVLPQHSGLPSGHVPFVAPGAFHTEYPIVIAGGNFGCGSSREHAPAALHIAGVKAVIARSYARIFYRNAVDGGFLIPLESEESLIAMVRTGDAVEIDCGAPIVRCPRLQMEFPLKRLGAVESIVAAGGLFAYARKQGMLNK